MKKALTRVILLAGWLILVCGHVAHAGVLGIAKTILKGGNPFLWFWAGVQGLMKLLEAHPTATKTILGTSVAMQLVGIVRGKGGFPWTLLLLAVTLLAVVALVVMLRRK
jgi:hypothetical protein